MNSSSLTAMKKKKTSPLLYSYREGADWACGSHAKGFTLNLIASNAVRSQHCMDHLYFCKSRKLW